MPEKRRVSDLEFIALIAMLMALVAFAINMILPAFSSIIKELKLTNENSVHLMVSLLYTGLAFGQIFYGSLSDSIGRKKAMYLGLMVFLIGCIISFFAKTLILLIVGQIIQGIGLGSPRVVTMAIVRDNYVGNEMGRILSFIMMIFVLVPTVSPYLGQSIINLSNWRTIFLVFIVLGLVMFCWIRLRLKESLLDTRRIVFSRKQLTKSVLLVFYDRKALGYTIVLGVFSGGFIAYLNLSQQIFEIQYGLGKRYPLIFAILSIGLGITSFINGKLVIRYGMERLSKLALTSNVIISVPFFVYVLMKDTQPPFWMFMLYMIAVLFCFGILVGNLNSMAMKTLGNIAGMGAAVVGAISTAISIPFATLIGFSYSNSVAPLVGGFAIFGIIALYKFLRTSRLK